MRKFVICLAFLFGVVLMPEFTPNEFGPRPSDMTPSETFTDSSRFEF